MPLTLLEGNVLPIAKTCDCSVAAGALLSIKAAETLDTERTVSLRGEGLTSQRGFTAAAQETLFMPDVILVGDTSFGEGLFALAALRSEASFVTRHTVVVVFVGDEGLGSDRLLAAMTRETVLVPRGSIVLQHLGTWHHRLVAGNTLGGELVAVTVAANQAVVLTGEGFVGQRAIAAETTEAVLVVISVVVEELFCVVSDDLLTLLAGVGVQLVVAGDAVRLGLHLDVFASVQGLVAVLAIEAVAHDAVVWSRSALCASAASGDALRTL